MQGCTVGVCLRSQKLLGIWGYLLEIWGYLYRMDSRWVCEVGAQWACLGPPKLFLGLCGHPDNAFQGKEGL